jgi:adenylate cyclase class 2
MQEIEAKFYVLDLNRIRMRLQALEARLTQERILETNIRFDLPDSGLRSEGRVLRLRQDTETRLTYKGPGINEQGVLNRTEIEFVVEDFGKAKQFLEALGYQKLIYYEKYRTTYEVKECHVMLDKLPFGDFVEIEGDSVESIHEVAEKLGLNWDVAIPTSYSALFEHLQRTQKLSFQDISFENFAGILVTPADLEVAPSDNQR